MVCKHRAKQSRVLGITANLKACRPEHMQDTCSLLNCHIPTLISFKLPQSCLVWLIQHKRRAVYVYMCVHVCACAAENLNWPTMEAVAALINQAECSADYKHSFPSGHKNAWHQKKCQTSQFVRFCLSLCVRKGREIQHEHTFALCLLLCCHHYIRLSSHLHTLNSITCGRCMSPSSFSLSRLRLAIEKAGSQRKCNLIMVNGNAGTPYKMDKTWPLI